MLSRPRRAPRSQVEVSSARRRQRARVWQSGTSVALVVSLGPPITLPTPWLSQDIGAVGRAGAASFANATGTYSVTGAGADIWGTADAFRFVYQPFSGDGQIVARVASVQNTNAWVKAGVMIRGDLTPGSAQAMMMVTPGKGNNFQRRLTNGGVSTGTAGALVTAPYWVKLTRAGNTVTASQSADGATWSIVGTATMTMGADALVGLAVSSHSTTVVATATFNQVAVSAGPPPVDPPPGGGSHRAERRGSAASGCGRDTGGRRPDRGSGDDGHQHDRRGWKGDQPGPAGGDRGRARSVRDAGCVERFRYVPIRVCLHPG